MTDTDQLLRALISLMMGQRKLSPIEELAYFQPPIVTITPNTSGDWIQVAGAVPNRVGLILGSSTTFNALPSNATPTGTYGGANFGGSAPPLMLTAAQWPGLVQSAWWVFAGPSTDAITTIEVVLTMWPASGG